MNGNGLPMPVGGPHSRSASGQYLRGGGDYGGQGSSSTGAFVGARSPPKAKSKESHIDVRIQESDRSADTSHVPCKFYPYGQCQAGAACQFSHDINATTQNAPCKYFAKVPLLAHIF